VPEARNAVVHARHESKREQRSNDAPMHSPGRWISVSWSHSSRSTHFIEADICQRPLVRRHAKLLLNCQRWNRSCKRARRTSHANRTRCIPSATSRRASILGIESVHTKQHSVQQNIVQSIKRSTPSSISPSFERIQYALVCTLKKDNFQKMVSETS